MIALPEAFVSRMSRQLGDELPDFLRALSMEPLRGIRMNRMKPFDGMDEYTKGIHIPWAEDGFILPRGSHAGSTVFHEAGAFYLQEPAAMLPAEVMNVQPGERILDLCAAPGGKSTQMALQMRGEGMIVCNEPILKRAHVLSRNLERIGIPNSFVTNCFPRKFPHTWDGLFDGVLIDAPCSGEGMFRRDPESRLEWTPEKASGCAFRQAEILREAVRFVCPGGRLVYATCTYNPQENENNIEIFLREHQDFSLEPFSFPCVDGKTGIYTCYPHRNIGEGQFVAKLRRKGEKENKRLTVNLQSPPAAEKEMFREQFAAFPIPNAKLGNILVHVPESPVLEGIHVLRAGIHLGIIKGKSIVPDHAAALSVFQSTSDSVELTPEEAAAYMEGNEIYREKNGWILIRYRELCLGWGKGSGGRIRNHYPKGLRKERIITDPC